MPTQSPFSLSVIIMTYNEEANLPRCLDSVKGLGDEIFILDSYSTDSTLDIASRYGARVEQHDFETFYRQRRRLIEKATYDWVLLLDADEQLSPELFASIEAVRAMPAYDGYYCNRRNRIGDTWIRHGSWYPDKKLRYFNRTKIVHVDNDPHDLLKPAPGAIVSRLKGDILHTSDKNLAGRFQAIERYSTRAANAYHAKGRRASLMRMLFKPCLRFFNSYILRLGLLDGYYGWIIARSEAMYVWMREVKLWEKQRNP